MRSGIAFSTEPMGEAKVVPVTLAGAYFSYRVHTFDLCAADSGRIGMRALPGPTHFRQPAFAGDRPFRIILRPQATPVPKTANLAFIPR